VTETVDEVVPLAGTDAGLDPRLDALAEAVPGPVGMNVRLGKALSDPDAAAKVYAVPT
jgi:hypothetical protein